MQLKSLTKRIFITIFLGLLALSAYFSIHSYYIHIHSAEENMLVNLRSITNTLSAQIDGNELQMILEMFPNKDDINTNTQTDYYKKQYQILKTTQELNDLPTPIYTLTYDSTMERFIFGVTSADNPYYRHTYESFPYELLKKYRVGGVLPAYEDENGVWLSAFSPIYNKGNVVGVVVADLPFENFIAKARKELLENIAVAIIVVLLVSFILYRLLSSILKEDRSRRLEIRRKNLLLNEKNREITSSLRYAKRIQEAILPSKKKIANYLGEHFIYYQPRDIVAGDFYWLCSNNNRTYVACADCTGHGVPGAMVSVLCSKALDDAINLYQLQEPCDILDKTSELVESAFEQSEWEINDGMDICLCCIDEEKGEITYAGAHNPLYQITREDSMEDYRLVEHKTDKQPIGRYHNRKPFKNNKLSIKKGDSFYLFTDGYADQFGGEKGKKFLYKKFKELLLNIHKIDMDSQLLKLDRAFQEWKGEEDQVDDVCVIGFRF